MTVSPIKWSFSSLKLFDNCPKKYYEIRIAKNFEDSPGEAALYGTELHTAAEEYVRDGKPLPKGFSFMQSQLDKLIEIDGEKLCEYEMALKADLSPCAFDDPEYFCRGIADLVVLNRDKKKAFIVDYKSGKSRYADTSQLALMAFMLFKHFPEIDTVKAGLLFTVEQSFIKAKYEREGMKELPSRFVESLDKLTNAMRYGVFNPKSSGLCGFCPVESCAYWRPKRR
jgi:hypothetical protein